MKYRQHKMMGRGRKPNEAGFTIVELMISLSVLSVLLLISTVTLIQLGRLYSKGVNQASAQHTARNLLNNIVSQLEFTGNTPQRVGNTICIGTTRYTFNPNHQLTSVATDHALWRDTMKSGAACVALNINAVTPSDSNSVSDSGVELIPGNMRIMPDFDVAPSAGGTYLVTVTVAYGDDDLVQYDTATHETSCKGGIGTEYCAYSSLAQTVSRRLKQ